MLKKTQKLTICLTVEDLRKIKALAKKDNRPPSTYVYLLVMEAIKNKKTK